MIFYLIGVGVPPGEPNPTLHCWPADESCFGRYDDLGVGRIQGRSGLPCPARIEKRQAPGFLESRDNRQLSIVKGLLDKYEVLFSHVSVSQSDGKYINILWGHKMPCS